MKLWTQRQVTSSMPRWARVHMVMEGSKWLKKWEMSKRRTTPTMPTCLVSWTLQHKRQAASGME